MHIAFIDGRELRGSDERADERRRERGRERKAGIQEAAFEFPPTEEKHRDRWRGGFASTGLSLPSIHHTQLTLPVQVDIFLSELERRLDFLENYGNLKALALDNGITRAYSTLQAVRATCSQVSGEVFGAGRRRAQFLVDAVETRYQDALVAKETLGEKVTTGIGLLEGILADFETRAYKMREQGFVGTAGSLMDEGRRVVDGGVERVREVVDEGIERARKAAETLEEHIEAALVRAKETGTFPTFLLFC